MGLSLAWELAQHDARVCVVDRGQLGKEASWAGAGMIPPGPDRSQWDIASPLEQLEGLSQELHTRWHEQLLEQTGVDNEYRRCGALQLALTHDEALALDNKAERWLQLGIACETLDPAALTNIEPALARRAAELSRIYHLPGETQIRNPRHLQALVAACESTGVALRPDVEVRDFHTGNDRIVRVETSEGPIDAEHFCLTAGSWSGELATRLGLALPVRPIRGQIVLLNGPVDLIRRDINVGPRYLVPRRDGRLLIGSTQEDVGFVNENTEAGVADLTDFAKSIAPDVGRLPVEARWAGLRPGSADGLPFLGRIPQLANAWLATGHFRAGLQLSPATAVVMRSLILGQEPPVDVTALGVERKASVAGSTRA